MKKNKSLHAIGNSAAIFSICLTAAACSKPSALSMNTQNTTASETPEKAPPSYETSATEVHFESVDEKGSFQHHEILLDPMRGEYRRGAWTASGKSQSIRLNPSAQIVSAPNGGAPPTTTSGSGSGNRVNLAFVGDGYTKADLPTYQSDVKNIIAQLKTQEPFLTYANYFNFNRVDVISQESGVSQDPKGKTRNTALGMSYYCSGIDRLLCGNLNKIASEAQNAGPVDAIFALANSETYGGAGYTNPPVATFAGRNPGSLELALHEFGHSFAHLADEYSDAGTANTCLNYTNIAQANAQSLQSSKSKWYRWLGFDGVGSFEGACYHTRGFYRPTDNSKMRALGQPFGAVNAEQFILELYKNVHPIDNATPEGTYSKNQIFSINPMQPIGHKLKISWTLDGKVLSSQDGVWNLDSSKLALANGSHTLIATVVDPTTQVRDEDARKKTMTQILTFKLNLSTVARSL